MAIAVGGDWSFHVAVLCLQSRELTPCTSCCRQAMQKLAFCAPFAAQIQARVSSPLLNWLKLLSLH